MSRVAVARPRECDFQLLRQEGAPRTVPAADRHFLSPRSEDAGELAEQTLRRFRRPTSSTGSSRARATRVYQGVLLGSIQTITAGYAEVDLIIIDEAHPGTGRPAVSSFRYKRIG